MLANLGVKSVRNSRLSGPASVPRSVLLGFLLVIATGTLFLSLPMCSHGGKAPRVLDAVFTACSATCVTGLVAVDTATQYNGLGQAIILLLIQVGGLGYMTAGTILAVMLGRRLQLQRMVLLTGERGELQLGETRAMARYIALFTFGCEGAGALVLAARFAFDFPLGKALAFGVFHSVSAFCNAGFDILGRDLGAFSSLGHYAGDPVITTVMALLIVLGGIGFVVVAEVTQKREWSSLSAHSKIVIAYTGALILLGAAMIWALEGGNRGTLGNLSPGRAAGCAVFEAITPRTAGFSMFAQERMMRPTALLVGLLMVLGASPGGTGGGIKTTTFAVLLAMLRAFTRGSEEVCHFDRRIAAATVNRAVGITLLALTVVLTATGLLFIAEHVVAPGPVAQQDPLYLFFEVCSAFGTVGLSCGVTPSLSSIGKVVIMVTMFIGRAGVLTLLLAVAGRRAERVHFPEGRIAVG